MFVSPSDFSAERSLFVGSFKECLRHFARVSAQSSFAIPATVKLPANGVTTLGALSFGGMSREPHLFRWQVITFATLWVGYAGYYVCRSNLSVAGPLLQAELANQPVGPTEEWVRQAREGFSRRVSAALESVRTAMGWQQKRDTAAETTPKRGESTGKRRFGLIASVSILWYALGKFASGMVSDFVGGRRMFLFGMFASVGCTVLFGLSVGFAALLVTWSLNRLVQSMGWSALVKVASRWFPVNRHGTIFGVLTLSYLFGDAIARLGLGLLLHLGLGWRGLFFAAAAVLAVIAAASSFMLKSSPADVGAAEPEANPENVYGEKGNAPRPANLLDLLWPLATDFSFWLVCIISFGLTLVRETFNVWNPIYLVEAAGMSDQGAATASALFPLVGGLSTITAGFLTDSVARGRRGTVMLPFLGLLVAALFGLSKLAPGSGALVPLALTSLISFALLGPYSFLTGVLSLDFGGKRGSSTAAGLADTAGYLGAIISGYGVGAIADEHGWSAAFGTLGGVAVLTFAAGALYWYLHDVRRPRGATGAAL
jgi:MFS transporter, OPA family, glycerol-3-phosphate transporter